MTEDYGYQPKTIKELHERIVDARDMFMMTELREDTEDKGVVEPEQVEVLPLLHPEVQTALVNMLHALNKLDTVYHEHYDCGMDYE